MVCNAAPSRAQEQGLVQITNYSGEDAEAPSWSPDGRAIAFVTNRGSGDGLVRDVWSVAPDGSNATRLTMFLDDGYDTGINSQNSGPWIGSTGDLAVYDTNGAWEWLRFELSQNPPLPVQRNVLNGPSPYFAELLVIPGGLVGDSFDVSRDGQSAAWSVRTTPGSCPFTSSAYVAPFGILNGQPATQVGTILASGTINCPYDNRPIRGMSYSPDASQVVLARIPDANYLGWDIEIYNSSGGLVRKLTNNGGGPNPVSNWNPRWSPDGTRIAFASNSSGQVQIYTIQPDGSNLTQVTTGGGDWPTWSPDSSTIAFESTRGGNSEIYSVLSMHGAIAYPRPVVFVHGFMGDSAGWGDPSDSTSFRGSLISELGIEGYTNNNNYDLYFDGASVRYSVYGNPSQDPLAVNSVPANARFFSVRFYSGNASEPFDIWTTANISVVNKAYELSQILKAITQITNTKDAVLIAHSQGGLVARTYIEGFGSSNPCTITYSCLSLDSPGHVKYGNNITHLLSLDSPYGGADQATLTEITEFALALYHILGGTGTPINVFELLPGSSVLNAINFYSGIGGVLPPKALPPTLTIDAMENYLGDLGYPCFDNPQNTCYSDDVVEKTSQSVRNNILPQKLTNKKLSSQLNDLPNPIMSYDPQVLALYPFGPCYPDLPDSPFPPSLYPDLLHWLACVGALTKTTQVHAHNSILPHLAGSPQAGGTPVSATLTATNPTASAAVLSGTVNPQGANGFAGFYYGTDPTLNTYNVVCPSNTIQNCPHLEANYATQSLASPATGLVSNSTYYFQMVFYDSDTGTYQYGVINSFKTKKPVVTTLAATNPTADAAMVNGTVNPQGANGFAGFYYGTDPTLNTYGVACSSNNIENCPALTANFAPQSFSSALINLVSNTKYYYRMVFYDSDNGTYQYGAIRSFKTLRQ